MRFTKTLQKTFRGIGMEPYKYDNGKIYKIVSPNTDKIYIGSTFMPLKDRLDAHRWNFDSYKRGKFAFVSSFDVMKEGNYAIELLVDYPCKSKKDLEKQEGRWQRQTVCVNRSIAGRTLQEWYSDNKEHVRQSGKRYREKNKAVLVKKTRLYRQKNKDKIKLQKKRKFICECGSLSTIDHKARHFRTKKHINFVKQ